MTDATNTPLPLAGYRILSVEQYGAGPYGTMFLAQLGAEVIKIESASGDTARAVGPHFLREAESLFFQTFNLNKRSIVLDLKSEAGTEVFHRLVERSHAVANNQRGDLPSTLGLTYEALEKVNPAIVCAHLSAYGRGNSREKWPGYDYLMQAEAGFLSLTGEPDGPPSRFGLSMVDFMAGTMMSIGLLAALIAAKDTGIGRNIDVDLLSAALHQTSYPAMWYLNEGDVVTRTPRSSHPSVSPSQLYRTSDGWIFIMAQLPKFWTILVDRIGHPHLALDPRFATPSERTANRDALTSELDAIFSAHETAHWLTKLQGHMPVAPVYDLDAALDNPYLDETGMIDAVSHHDRSDMKVLANPIRIDGARLPNRAAPLLGEDTDAVLAEAGYDSREIEKLRRDGVI